MLLRGDNAQEQQLHSVAWQHCTVLVGLLCHPCLPQATAVGGRSASSAGHIHLAHMANHLQGKMALHHLAISCCVGAAPDLQACMDSRHQYYSATQAAQKLASIGAHLQGAVQACGSDHCGRQGGQQGLVTLALGLQEGSGRIAAPADSGGQGEGQRFDTFGCKGEPFGQQQRRAAAAGSSRDAC